MEVTQKSFARKKPDQLVYLELGSGNGGMLLSISEDGFRFRAVSPLRPNGLMPFAFSFDGDRRMQGIGEVEWLEDDGKSGGMRFVEVSADFRAALDQWLALDSPRGNSGREATPAAATPLDTMEKIRAELRRGYPQAPAKSSARKESQGAAPDVSAARHEQPAQKSGLESQQRNAQPTADRPERMERSVAGNKSEQIAGQKPGHTDLRTASSVPTSEREQRNTSAAQPERPNVDGKLSAEHHSRPFYPPPFTHPAESETPSSEEKTNSAFLKKTSAAPVSTPTEDAAAHSAFNASQHAAPVAPAPPPSREHAHLSTEALRRPFRQESRSSHLDRPYIPPPVDESFEAAWEHAKLTSPPESPHLSRAAAGSIIGVALAVILGALAFNFRADIGQLVIDLGQKISGEHPTAAPSSSTVADGKLESQTPTDAGTPQAAPSSNKLDAAAGNSANTEQPSDGASHPANSHGAERGATHEAPLSSATRGSTPATSASGTANRTAAGGTGLVAPALSSAGTANPTNGSEIGTEPGSGQEEFNAAREMLRGDHRHRDLSRAVDLLWAGVRKGYVPAEVTLADLYRRGDGVTKNCDQAQVLLVAASKKGSPEARQLLEQMAEEGCRE